MPDANAPRVEMGFFDLEKKLDAGGEVSSAGIPYFVFGAEDEDAALAAVLAEAGESLGNASLTGVEIAERISADTFKVTASYETSRSGSGGGSGGEEEEEGDNFSFETGGGSLHLSTSTGTTRYPADAPDYSGAIGVDSDGTVHGVDVTMPSLTFCITKKYALVTASMISAMASLTGKVNSSAFHGFEAGEVLFMGASGGKNGDKWEVSYKFAVSPNETDLTIGGIAVAKKDGWDYAWVRYKESAEGNVVTRVPESVYVEKVYSAASFAALGV